jgi:hypothetical protein
MIRKHGAGKKKKKEAVWGRTNVLLDSVIRYDPTFVIVALSCAPGQQDCSGNKKYFIRTRPKIPILANFHLRTGSQVFKSVHIASELFRML